MKKLLFFILSLFMLYLPVFASGDCADTGEHSFGEWQEINYDIRTRVCNVCGETESVERMLLPMDYKGIVFVEEIGSGVYVGTRNVADVLGIKEGVFSNGEVSISIVGTHIELSGTPTKNLYFDLQNGKFGVPDYKRDVGYELPDGTYRFGIYGTGNYMPTLCIRNADGIGNCVSASQGARIRTVSNINVENFGVPYLYFPKGQNYDFSGNFVLTLGGDSIYDTQESNVEKINSEGECDVDGCIWTASQDAAVFAFPDEKRSLIVCNNKNINLYLPQVEGYLKINMSLVDNASTNAYGWRLNMMYACDDSLNVLFPITNSGEYEAAIKLRGRSDFMGMGAHGSERMTDFAIAVDGVATSLDLLSELTEWQTVHVTRSSDFYDPKDETTVVAKHVVDYFFDQNGLTVEQSVEWLVDEECTISYMMMFPVRRQHGELQITDTYYDDYDMDRYDVSQSGFGGYPKLWTPGASKMVLFSEKSGVWASMENVSSTQLNGGGYKNCHNGESYNKLYFTICGGGSTSQIVNAGDVWGTETRYEVQLMHGTDKAYPHSYTAGLCAVCGYDSVSAEVESGILTVYSSDIAAGTDLYFACRSELGRMLSVEVAKWSENGCSFAIPDGATWKLMFMDGGCRVLREPIIG